MAFRDFSNVNPNTPDVFKEGFFNVTLAVGNKEVGTGLPAANTPTDMMLVYYCLFKIYRDGDRKLFRITSEDNFNSPKALPTAKDYTSSDTKKKIARLILRFQNDLKKNGSKIFADGRCDRGRGSATAVTHSGFTIHALNFFYAGVIEKSEGRTDWQDFLLGDPLTPSQLKQEVATNIELG